ncbi:cytochrome P450 [Candidatus Planktophila dulcis]|uniref:cytochrome P450 n=1 Tax=Candidatus Planktophila dulcis TaxID=1884914 RepID=UPI000BACDFB5|nr:cytochrome P450 [Candidatus Planktophila dulcis]ASY15187.1 cytochrome P450 [Candidatus Planktophila dulcis]
MDCPHKHNLPSDGTPLKPSPTLDHWRESSAITPLSFPDGHEGWIALEQQISQEILMDTRFSQQPHRFPGLAPQQSPEEFIDEQDQLAITTADLLALDGDQHRKCRKTVTSKFSFKAVNSYTEAVSALVSKQLSHLLEQPQPVDLTEHFSEPISIANHAFVLGIPDSMVKEFERTFVGSVSRNERITYLREVYQYKLENPGEDVISHLIQSELTQAEVEGLIYVFFTSGRDSVAYMISTSMVALLQNPNQLNLLRNSLPVPAEAIEELMRFCAMFVTLFPRTALEDLELHGQKIQAGQSISVSPVAVNRDPRIWSEPNSLKLNREVKAHLSFGHGIHGCLGQQLARLVIQESLTQLLRAINSIELVSAEQLEPMEFAHPVATYKVGSVFINFKK